MRKLLLSSLFLSLFIIGCDKVDDPFVDQNGGGGEIAADAQKVLLEDLTGFRCTNCPQAHDIGENLKNIYGDQLIILAVHGSAQFSTPNAPGSAMYTTDFRTEASVTYFNELYSQVGLPSGGVNRISYDGSRAVAPSAWGEKIAPLVEQTAKANLDVVINDYDENTRTVDFDVPMAITSDLGAGSYYMIAHMVEDSIYDWQLDNGVNVENYLHRHTLRDNVNGTWGELVFENGASGQENTLSYQYTIDPAWKQEHCEIVAYLYHGDTREVIQVNKAWVMNP